MSPSPCLVRALEPADETDWRRLWAGYQRFYEVSLSEEVHLSTWRRLHDPAEPVFGALALPAGGGPPFGLVHFIRHRTGWDVADSCYLQDLYVDDAARGQGVGAALIDYVAAAAAGFGAAQVHWLTHETNTRAMRLYDAVAVRSGFVQYRLPITGRDA